MGKRIRTILGAGFISGLAGCATVPPPKVRL